MASSNSLTSMNQAIGNANIITATPGTSLFGQRPLNLVLNDNDKTFPIASYSLYRLGFTYGQVLHIQNLVAAQGFDPESAVWVQKLINKDVHRDDAKNLFRLVMVGWEFESALQYLRQPEARGWNKNGKSVIPPPLDAIKMMNAGWLPYDAMKWLKKHEGRMGNSMPLPRTVVPLMKVGWTKKDALARVIHWNGQLPDSIPFPPAVYDMMEGGWPQRRAVAWLVKRKGVRGRAVPVPPTAVAMLKVGWKMDEAVACLVLSKGHLPEPIPLPPAVPQMMEAGWQLKDAVQYLVEHGGKLGTVIPPPSTKSSITEKFAKSLKLSDEGVAVAAVQQFGQNDSAGGVADGVRTAEVPDKEIPAGTQQMSAEEYNKRIHEALHNLVAKEQIWRNVRSGSYRNPRNDNMSAELGTVQQEIKLAEGAATASSEVERLGMLLRLKDMTSRMDKEMTKIRGLTGVHQAVADADEAERATVRKKAASSDDVIVFN